MEPKEPSGPYVSLQEHLEQRIDDLHQLIEERFANQGKALELAADSLSMRLNNLNKLREAMASQEQRYAMRETVEIRLDRLDSDVRELLLSKAELAGKASMTSVIVAYVLALASILLGTLHVAMGIGK